MVGEKLFNNVGTFSCGKPIAHVPLHLSCFLAVVVHCSDGARLGSSVIVKWFYTYLALAHPPYTCRVIFRSTEIAGDVRLFTISSVVIFANK